MTEAYTYIIVGAGLAGASAIQGIRERDKKGSILLVGTEKYFPYNRPPLTKSLWFGKKKVEAIFINNEEFYRENAAKTLLNTTITAIDAGEKTVRDDKNQTYRYEKLLLAMGGIPRVLSVEGGNLEGVCYYRYLDDFLSIHTMAKEGKTAVVIGGGFIGSEIAAALNINKLKVTMIFPDTYLVQRIFPEYLGRALQKIYIEKGITVLSANMPVRLTKNKTGFVVSTNTNKNIECDLLIAGIGITPAVKPAETAGLKTADGVVVNEYLQTSDPDIFAAGDIADFPYAALNRQMRVEHWDNALNQGKQAGLNMAGANVAYTYMPYFFSDLFEFGYEAVGDINSQLETFADWQKENDTGVVYYLKNNKVTGVMTCNIWEQMDAARKIIEEAKTIKNLRDLQGLIQPG